MKKTSIIKIIHNTKYCKATVKTGQQCTKFKTKDTNYCRYHNVWTTYTPNQLNQIGKCGYCELYAPIIVFDAKTMRKNWKNWCDTCVTKNTFCKGLTTQDIPCGYFSSEGKFYCDYHHLNNPTTKVVGFADQRLYCLKVEI
jgi:hypothetical protein